MKTTAVFINMGRGSSVKEVDLIKILKEKMIKGAVLDVFQEEPLNSNSEIYDLDNVLISCHSADNTDDFFELWVEVLFQNFESFEKTGSYFTIVDKIKGY